MVPACIASYAGNFGLFPVFYTSTYVTSGSARNLTINGNIVKLMTSVPKKYIRKGTGTNAPNNNIFNLSSLWLKICLRICPTQTLAHWARRKTASIRKMLTRVLLGCEPKAVSVQPSLVSSRRVAKSSLLHQVQEPHTCPLP